MWILIALAVGVMYIVDPLLPEANVDNTDNREYNEIERLYGIE